MKFHPNSPELETGALDRLQYLAALRRALNAKAPSRLRQAHESRGGLQHPTPEQSGPEARAQVRDEFEAMPEFRLFSATMRASQDLMWRYIDDAVDAESPSLETRYRMLDKAAGGSVILAPLNDIPDYLTAEDTHRMPGGYLDGEMTDDLRAGALYDIGGVIYQLGLGNMTGKLFNDSRGRTLVAHLRQYYNALAPGRILDLGCSVGHNTVPLVDTFPKAEVYGLDIGAPMLRYAHLRSEGLGRRIHYIQANAENTGLPSGDFDLVVSQIMLHETSTEAVRNILRESRRLVRPGGVVVHLEVPLRYEHMNLVDQYLRSWEQYYNAEPHIEGLAATDLAAEATAAGLDQVIVGFQRVPDAGRDAEPMFDHPNEVSGPCWYIVSGVGV